ncbi:hypothetical protein AYO38_07795 [bacterium SCGC AG-212-C10]|nr:hypothetical protein AYO38_07795 [bacterium SCGC AG-212-C10]
MSETETTADAYRLRFATFADAEVILAQRKAMFIDMGDRDETALDAMGVQFIPWLERQFAAGTYCQWLVEHEGVAVGGAAVWTKDRLPGVRGPRMNVAYVLNVYVDPAHRRYGLARRMMEAILAWSREQGFSTVELHASDQGRPLYASMGFAATNEMRFIL